MAGTRSFTIGETLRPERVGARLRDYLGLCKLKVVALIVFTAMVGMFLAAPGMVPLDAFLLASLGIGMAAASAAAINQLVDARVDACMRRTQARPLPSGALSERQCLVFSLLLGAAAMAVLWLWVNPLTAVLTFVSLIGYAVIYTMFLKRATPQNIVIGGAAGAAPPLLGWAAITGEVTAEPLLLFLIIFTWTPPHFWALAIHRRDEYARAGIPMLPVTHGVDFTRLQVLLYTVLLVVISVLPFAIHMSGLLYLVAALALGAGFLRSAWRLMHDLKAAMPTFGYSIVYLMGLFAALLIDHYIPY